MIAALAGDGAILPAYDFVPDQIQPASLDLRLGEVAYRVRASFLPGPDTTVAERIDELKLHEIALGDGAVLETGCVYIVALIESLALPEGIAAAANPKSSTGRLDVFTRVIADETRGFDHISVGYHGPLYAEISPRTFPVLVREGSRLSQIRFRRGNALLDAETLRALHARERLVDDDDADVSEGIAVSVDLAGLGPDGLVGYRAKRHTGLIDVERRAGYDVADFWEPMYSRKNQSLILDPDEFYILASKEAVQVPPDYAAEMVPFDPLVGEFRVHYAGFFDPGFGYAGAGGRGARAVLEVRSREVPFILEHGQIVGRLVYERMLERPHSLYGERIGSNYQAQRIHETNHFRGFALFRYLDLFARLFLLQQFFQRLLIVILKLFGLEMPSLGFNDVRRQIRHVLRNLFIFDVVEIHVLLAHLIWIPQRDAEKTLAARFERHDMLTRGEDHAGEGHHAFLADRLADDRERLLADFAIRRDVVGAVEIQLLDFFFRHEFVDLDRSLALDAERLKLFGLDRDVFALAHFVAFDDVGRVDLVSGLGIDLSVFDTIARLFIELVEADLFSLTARGEECDRTRYEREFQIAFPIRTWGHD